MYLSKKNDGGNNLTPGWLFFTSQTFTLRPLRRPFDHQYARSYITGCQVLVASRERGVRKPICMQMETTKREPKRLLGCPAGT